MLADVLQHIWCSHTSSPTFATTSSTCKITDSERLKLLIEQHCYIVAFVYRLIQGLQLAKDTSARSTRVRRLDSNVVNVFSVHKTGFPDHVTSGGSSAHSGRQADILANPNAFRMHSRARIVCIAFATQLYANKRLHHAHNLRKM